MITMKRARDFKNEKKDPYVYYNKYILPKVEFVRYDVLCTAWSWSVCPDV